MLRSLTYMVAVTATLTGCVGRPAPNARGGELPESAHVTILELDRIPDLNGSVLDVMIGRVPSLKVTSLHPCPVLALRGENTVPGRTDPQVYVNGARASDTCILTSLQAADVERVEVYPLGFTRRPGYATGAHGLILVFLRRAERE